MLWKKKSPLLSASLIPTPIPSFIPQSPKKYFFRRKNQIPIIFINFSVIMKSFLAKKGSGLLWTQFKRKLDVLPPGKSKGFKEMSFLSKDLSQEIRNWWTRQQYIWIRIPIGSKENGKLKQFPLRTKNSHNSYSSLPRL